MNIEKGALEFVAWLEAIVKDIDGDITEIKDNAKMLEESIKAFNLITDTLVKRSTEQQIEIEKLLATVTKVDEFLKRVYK